MTALNGLKIKYSLQTFLLCLGIAGIFMLAKLPSLAWGLMLGSIFSIINFILLTQSLPLRSYQGRSKLSKICLGNIWLRYLLLALPLFIATYSNRFDFFSTAAGLLMIQVTMLCLYFGRAIFTFFGKSRSSSDSLDGNK